MLRLDTADTSNLTGGSVALFGFVASPSSIGAWLRDVAVSRLIGRMLTSIYFRLSLHHPRHRLTNTRRFADQPRDCRHAVACVVAGHHLVTP